MLRLVGMSVSRYTYCPAPCFHAQHRRMHDLSTWAAHDSDNVRCALLRSLCAHDPGDSRRILLDTGMAPVVEVETLPRITS